MNFGSPQRSSSAIISMKSDLSSQGSINLSFSSVSTTPIMTKDLNTNQIIRLKKEGSGKEMPGLRKRVCRKVYSILYKEFKKPQKLSKKLTLAIEYRINIFYPYQEKNYIKIVKLLFKKLRVFLFKLSNFYLETHSVSRRIDQSSSGTINQLQ